MSKAKPVVDLAALDTVSAANQGARVELRHPVSNEPLGVFITVVGKESDIVRSYYRQKFNENLRREAMARKKGRDINNKTAEDFEQDAIDLLVTCTIGWENMVFNGKPLEFNKANVQMIYETRPWVRSQVDEEMGDMANFLKV